MCLLLDTILVNHSRILAANQLPQKPMHRGSDTDKDHGQQDKSDVPH